MAVAALVHEEAAQLNTGRLEEICQQLGYDGGEAAICAAMEDLATLLRRAGEVWRAADVDMLDLCARQIMAIADRIGMVTLARVAGDVAALCAGVDDAALGAAVARMMRLGDGSLLAVWQAQDPSL